MKVKNFKLLSLTGVTQWVGHRPANHKVAGLIPGQGTCLGCGPDSLFRGVLIAAD